MSMKRSQIKNSVKVCGMAQMVASAPPTNLRYQRTVRADTIELELLPGEALVLWIERA